MEHTKLQKHTEKREKFFEEEPNNLFNLEAKKAVDGGGPW